MTRFTLMMKRVLSSAIVAAALLSGCGHAGNASTESRPVSATDSVPAKDCMLKKSVTELDGESFLVLVMNADSCRVELADSVIPDIDDPTIALCVEAAFTGELMKEFKPIICGRRLCGGRKAEEGLQVQGEHRFSGNGQRQTVYRSGQRASKVA